MKWINISLETLLIFLILFSPLIYGSITVLPLTIVELVSFILLFIFLLKLYLQEKFSLIRAPFLALILFTGFIIFQLIPLPAGLLKAISPSTWALYRDFRPGYNYFFTLSIYPDATVNLLLQLLSFLAVFFVTLNYIDNEERGRRVILAVILSGFLCALFGLIRRFTVPVSGFSTFTNRNHFAAYMEMIIPLGITFALIEKEKTRKAILIFMTSVMGLALLLSLSRGGVICFFLSLLLALGLLRLKHRLKKGLMAIVSLGFLLSLFLAAIGAGSITKRLETLQNPLKAMAGRTEVLKDAPKMIADFPVFGTGFGTFIDIFPKYKTFESKTYRFAHNEPLQLAVETGILGFLLFFTFLLLYSKDVFSLWLKRRNPFAVYITLACFIGLISVSLHSFIEFMFHVPAVALLFLIILALMFRVVYIKEEQSALPVPQRVFILSKSLKLVVIGVACFSFLSLESFIVKRYQAEVDFYSAKGWEVNRLGPEIAVLLKRSLKEINQAIRLNPLNSGFFARKADFLCNAAGRVDVQDILSFDIESIAGPEDALSRAEKLYMQALALNPTKAEYHFRLGLVLNSLGREEEARKQFMNVRILDPHNKFIK